jgi:hypothetical protein
MEAGRERGRRRRDEKGRRKASEERDLWNFLLISEFVEEL